MVCPAQICTLGAVLRARADHRKAEGRRAGRLWTNRETIEKAVAAGGDQIGLAAAARSVRRIPRASRFLVRRDVCCASNMGVAGAIEMPEHRDTRPAAFP